MTYTKDNEHSRGHVVGEPLALCKKERQAQVPAEKAKTGKPGVAWKVVGGRRGKV